MNFPFVCSVNEYLQDVSLDVNVDFLRAMNSTTFDRMVPLMPNIMSFVTQPEEVELVKETSKATDRLKVICSCLCRLIQ